MLEATEPRPLEDELFAYAAGALDSRARLGLEARLDADPALRARLAWHEAVCESVIEEMPLLERLPSADAIIERVRGRTTRRGVFAWLAGPALRPVAAFATALIVIQGALIAVLTTEHNEVAKVRSARPVEKAVVFVVAFNPETKESRLRALLLEAGASIIEGPRQLGEYRLSVPANRAEYAESVLRQSGIVEYVRVEGR